MRTVSIDGREWVMAYNLRSLFIYEEIAGHPYTGERTIDSYVFMYAMLQANNPEFAVEFDAFIDSCDSNPEILDTFLEVMKDEAARVSAFHSKKKAGNR